MLQLVLAAPRSGSGKTTAACALLAALTARGLTPCAFKSGPDYIDPMFHRAVLGVESHNLDLFFSAPQLYLLQKLPNRRSVWFILLRIVMWCGDDRPYALLICFMQCSHSLVHVLCTIIAPR